MSHHSLRWKLYQAELICARAMRDAEPERIDYWTGYERGLQRAHYGERFGTNEDHRTWLDMVGAEGADRQARGSATWTVWRCLPPA